MTIRRIKEGETDYAREQAAAQLATIVEMVATELNGDQDAIESIQEHPLEIAVRPGWHVPVGKLRHLPGGASPGNNAEYYILLTWGGTAVRIIGDLGHYEPISARLEYQDWGTPWTQCHTTSDEDAALMTYAEQFYYGG